MRVGSIRTPIAVFQGVSDGTVSAAGARALISDVGSADKALYLYAQMGHNMSIEPDVRDWLLGRLEQPPPAHAMLLHVRQPATGVVWRQLPPGAADANVGTVLETVREPERQAQMLDELLQQSRRRPL
jgi:fermentation-respiration switch protein FrsA (DUF1100 family)